MEQSEITGIEDKKAPFSSDKTKWLSASILALALVGWAWVLFYQLDKPLLGPHSFRQTQTAITARYLAEDASKFWNYITPVLGKPWEIPMEVPIYQWVVAMLHRLLGAEASDLARLDKVGRLVSAFAWLFSLVPAWAIGRWLGISQSACMLVGALMLSSPVYLFWGRAFLIETTAVFLALTMVALALWGFEKRSYSLLIAAGVVGILGALCKAPTWGLAVGVTFLLLLIRADVYRRENWYWACGAIVAVTLGFFAAKYWVAWSDAVKQANPFARELITLNSENQRAWNYGTLEQKLNIKTWEVIFQHAIEGVLVKVPFLGAFFLPLVIIFAGALYPYRALQMGAFVIAFLAGPLIFTNLYFQHSYYWIANGACLLLGMGVAFSAIEEGVEEWGNWIAAGIGFVAVSFGFVNWNAIYKPILDALPTRSQLAEVWTEPVQKFVPKERTLLVVGNDWNSNSLYYCDRKGIAFPNFYKIPFPGPQLAESLANLQPHESLGAVVVAEPLFNQNKMIFEEFLKTHGFSLNGIQTAFGILFPANTFAEKKGE